MRLFSQYDNHERNYKPVNNVFFTHFELGYLTSYNILPEHNGTDVNRVQVGILICLPKVAKNGMSGE